MARTICKVTTILMAVVMVAGIVVLIYALVSDSYYDPNAVVRHSDGTTTTGAQVSNSTWAWVGGIMLGVATPLFMIGLFGWVFSSMMSGTRKVLAGTGVDGALGGLLGTTGTASGPRAVESTPPTRGSPI